MSDELFEKELPLIAELACRPTISQKMPFFSILFQAEIKDSSPAFFYFSAQQSESYSFTEASLDRNRSECRSGKNHFYDLAVIHVFHIKFCFDIKVSRKFELDVVFHFILHIEQRAILFPD